MRTVIRQSTKQPLQLTSQLGAGGEAVIYALGDDLVAKIYHQWRVESQHKLPAMLARPPSDLLQGQHVAIAWPCELLYDLQVPNRIVGFLMPRVRGLQPIFEFYNPKSRRALCPLFTYRYLLNSARNLAWAICAVHKHGYVIGDVNESNILVKDTGQVTLVDTDSFQVPEPRSGTFFRCPVGKPDFTPPELQTSKFTDIDRTVVHDRFGLAVLLFRLLQEGAHPFDGCYTGAGEAPALETRIAAGHFPYSTRSRVPYLPKPSAVPFTVLPQEVQRLFIRCFEDGFRDANARPSSEEWVRALDAVAGNLRQCTVNPSHVYAPHLAACPWCARTKLLGADRDPFPSPQAVRQRLHTPPSPRRPSPIRRVATAPPRAVISTSPAPTARRRAVSIPSVSRVHGA